MSEEYTDEQLRDQAQEIMQRAGRIQWDWGDWALRAEPVVGTGIRNGSGDRLKRLLKDFRNELGSDVPVVETILAHRRIAKRFPPEFRDLGPYTVYRCAISAGWGPEDIIDVPPGYPEGKWDIPKIELAILIRSKVLCSVCGGNTGEHVKSPKIAKYKSKTASCAGCSKNSAEPPGNKTVSKITGPSGEVPQLNDLEDGPAFMEPYTEVSQWQPDAEPDEPDEPDDDEPVYKRRRSGSITHQHQERPRPQVKSDQHKQHMHCIKCSKCLDPFEEARAVAGRAETGGPTMCDECRALPEPEPVKSKPKKLEPGQEPGDDAEWKQLMELLSDATEKLGEAAYALIGLKYSDERYSEMLDELETADNDIRDLHKWGQDKRGGLRAVN